MNPKRIPDEPNQPAAYLWRDVKVVTKNDFGKAAKALRLAADVRPLKAEEVEGGRWKVEEMRDNNSSVQPSTSNLQPVSPSPTIQSLRDWMAKHVRIAGPSLYEVPIAQQLTDPKIVITERYASRLDYVRTLCALLKGAGYDADIVFAAQNASLSEEVRKRDKYELPNVRAFATAVCRVRETTGGFLGIGGETKTYFIGTENEYTPLETTALEGSDFFDPETKAFGVIAAADKSFTPNARSTAYITVRENGAVDYQFESKLWGAGVGAFRKRYAEILPEDFSRHYQQLLGTVSKAASATKELTPDIKSYPATLSFECFIPDFATVEGDTITVKLPPFDCPIPALPGSVRHTPVALGAQEASLDEVIVRFPKDYAEVEHMPETFVLDERHDLFPRMRNDVWTETVDGCLEVHVSRVEWERPSCFFSADYAELFRDWRRRTTSLASRTIVVRRKRQ